MPEIPGTLRTHEILGTLKILTQWALFGVYICKLLVNYIHVMNDVLPLMDCFMGIKILWVSLGFLSMVIYEV